MLNAEEIKVGDEVIRDNPREYGRVTAAHPDGTISVETKGTNATWRVDESRIIFTAAAQQEKTKPR
jgi:hypothetical protein